MKIFIISGKARFGKTTVANTIKENLDDSKTLIIPFATYLKRYMKEYLEWDGLKTEWFRTEAQRLGTDVIRYKLKDPTFHVRRICEDIRILYEMGAYENFVIDDCRFLNELCGTMTQFPHKTISIRVERGEDFTSDLTEEQLNHPSENDLDNYKGFDYTILNNGNMNDLQEKINDLLIDVIKEI